MIELISTLKSYYLKNAYPQSTSNEDLGWLRILFFSMVFLTTATGPLMAEYSKVGADLYCSDTMGAWIYIRLTPGTAEILLNIYRMALLACIVGFLTPAAYWVTILSSTILNFDSLKFCFWDHRTLPLQVAFLFWALLDTNSSYRLDNRIFKTGKKASGDPDFVLQMMRVNFCVVFFAAGVSKFRYGGIEWITTDSLKNYLILQNYFFADSFPERMFSFLNHYVVKNPWICNFFALETVLVEILAPLALFRSNWTRSLVWHLLMMQIGIYFLMYFKFTPWLALYVFWLPTPRRFLLKLGSTFRVRPVQKRPSPETKNMT